MDDSPARDVARDNPALDASPDLGTATDVATEGGDAGIDAVIDARRDASTDVDRDAIADDAPDTPDGGDFDASTDWSGDSKSSDAADISTDVVVIDGVTNDVQDDRVGPPADDGGGDGGFAGSLAACESTFIGALPDAGSVTLTPSLGFQTAVSALLKDGDFVAGSDTNGYVGSGYSGGYALWNAATGKEIVQGMPGRPLGLAGGVFAVFVQNELRLLNASDGSLRATLTIDPFNTRTGLALDGSYVWTATSAGLSIWSSDGTPWATKSGDYLTAEIYAAPDELRVGHRHYPPTAVIENIVPNGGRSTNGAAFVGEFTGWFRDGSKFFTAENGNLHVYSLQGVQLDVLVVSGWNMGGSGKYLWTQAQYELQIYEVGGNGQPIQKYALDARARVVASANRLAVIDDGPQQVSLVRLDQSPPTAESLYLPFSEVQVFAAEANGAVTFGGKQGEVFYRGTASAPSRSGRLGCGRALQLAGSPSGTTAVSTATNLLVFNWAESTATAIKVVAGNITYLDTSDNLGLVLSGDGHTLVAAASDVSPYFTYDRTVYIYQWPAWNIVRLFPSENGRPNSVKNAFDLSLDGTTFALQLGKYSTDWSFETSVADPVAGSPTQWTYSGANDGVPLLSPDGHHFSVTSGFRASTASTAIYEDGTLIKTVLGSAVGWVDNGRLLVQSYTMQSGNSVYASSAIYDARGSLLSTPPLPEVHRFDVIDQARILSRQDGRIYDVVSGAAVSNTGLPAGSVVAGPYIISVVGRELRVTRY